MYNLKFQKYLSKKLNIDFTIIHDLFEIQQKEEFQIALILINDYKVDKNFLGKIWGDFIGFAYVDPNNSIVNRDLVKK